MYKKQPVCKANASKFTLEFLGWGGCKKKNIGRIGKQLVLRMHHSSGPYNFIEIIVPNHKPEKWKLVKLKK